MDSLLEMGFPINASKRAMYFSNDNVEAAMNWLCTHIDDPDYDTGTTHRIYFLYWASLFVMYIYSHCNFIEFSVPAKPESSIPSRPTENDIASLPDQFKVFTNIVLNQINYPTPNSKIYKEECVLSCDTVYSPDGLYVCLKSFLAYGLGIL